MTTATRVLSGLQAMLLTFALANAHARLGETVWSLAFFLWSVAELVGVVVVLIRLDTGGEP